MCYESRSINVQNEEREECLDVFSTCETCLREEVSLTNQLFDDLGAIALTTLKHASLCRWGDCKKKGLTPALQPC